MVLSEDDSQPDPSEGNSMTMAKVETGGEITVGLPPELRSVGKKELRALGWQNVIGGPIPTDPVEPGYRHAFGEPYSVTEDGKIAGTWSVTQQPQPYPSWSWVDGEGWVPPVPKPSGNYVWDEEKQKWVASDFSA